MSSLRVLFVKGGRMTDAKQDYYSCLQNVLPFADQLKPLDSLGVFAYDPISLVSKSDRPSLSLFVKGSDQAQRLELYHLHRMLHATLFEG